MSRTAMNMILRTRTGQLACAILLLYFQHCNLIDRGFRFTAGYEAVKSGYRLLVVSKGFVKPGDDLANSAFASVTICPDIISRGKTAQMTLTAQPEQWVKLDCEALGAHSVDLNWKSSENVLASLLTRCGYNSLVPDEIRGSVRVMMSSLTGPKGVILEGQIASLRVLYTKIDYGYSVNESDPPKRWIDASEFPKCAPEK